LFGAKEAAATYYYMQSPSIHTSQPVRQAQWVSCITCHYCHHVRPEEVRQEAGPDVIWRLADAAWLHSFRVWTSHCIILCLYLDHAPPHVQVCYTTWLSFTRPSPTLVLQATNAGARRPGYKA